MKSDTHSVFGAGTRNWRLTWSSGQGAALSLTVVRTGLPRITPASPMTRISRATVQRATATPSRRSWRHTLCTRRKRRGSHRTQRLISTWRSPASRLRARGQTGRIGTPGRMLVVGGWGNRQHLADRLDPVRPPVIVNEGDHRLNGRSSSAWAKYALALRKISLAWRSSRFSRSSARSFSATSAGHASALARVHLGLLCPVMQRLRGAADLGRNRLHRRPTRSGARPHARAASAPRARAPRAKNFLVVPFAFVVMAPSFSRVGASGKPGAVQTAGPTW